MTKVKKVGSKYQVYDHVLNLTRKFKYKVEADKFAESLDPKPTEDTEEGQTTTDNKQSNVES